MNDTVYMVFWTLCVAPIDHETALRWLTAQDTNYFRIIFATENDALCFVDELRRFFGNQILMLNSLAMEGAKVRA